ncbi:SIMPL domain-containing protein [Solibacillus silvestris]|uniref:SIMPL domain-containing protein n=1 Tax=Solibacillus silvestris TaxID=76853 RepID=UPI003F80AE33
MYYPQTFFQPFAASPREMTVTGNGEVAVQPDFAQIQIEVRTQGENVSMAQQENAVIMNRVIESLNAINIPEEAIQTAAYTIFPNYDFIEGRQVLRGYEVQNAITVEITDIRQVGTVIDTAIQNGANHVSAIQFKTLNADAHYRQALQYALMDAIGKARSLAETMHVNLQSLPVEIIEESNIAAPIPFKAFKLSNEQPVTPIEPGIITVTAAVRVKFRF